MEQKPTRPPPPTPPTVGPPKYFRHACAQIDGLNKDGTKALRETFKVSAKIPAEDKEKNVGPVGIVAKVFRVAPPSVSSMEQGEDGADAAGAAAGEKLVVVLRRKRGNYYR